MNKNKLQNIYGYNLDHGDMIIFWDNLKYCIQYNNWNPNSNLDIAKKYQYNQYNNSFLEIYLDSKNGGLAVKIDGGSTMLFTPDKWV